MRHCARASLFFPSLTSLELHIETSGKGDAHVDTSVLYGLGKCTRISLLLKGRPHAKVRFGPSSPILRLPSLRELSIDADENVVFELPMTGLPPPSTDTELVSLCLGRHAARALLSPLAFHLPHIRRLKIHRGTDRVVPAAVFSLVHLEELVLEDFGFVVSIPPDIGRLTNLTLLEVSCDAYDEYDDSILVSITPQITRLAAFKVLILRYRGAILYLPENFCLLSCPTRLDVVDTYCDLGDIFHSQGVFPSLTDLGFSVPEGGEPLPDVVFRPSLRKLTISRICGALPESLGLASGLTSLSISGPGYSSSIQLPGSLWDLPALKVLEIFHAWLESLPLAFTKLSKLEKLDLSHNRLSTLPPLESLTLLQYLDVSNNQLTSVPSLAGLTNLRYVNLSHNKLATPPQGLLSLPSLEEVTLDSTCIDGLYWWQRKKYARLPIRKVVPPNILGWVMFVAGLIALLMFIAIASILFISVRWLLSRALMDDASLVLSVLSDFCPPVRD